MSDQACTPLGRVRWDGFWHYSSVAAKLLRRVTSYFSSDVYSIGVASCNAHGARVTRKTAEEGVGRDKKRNRQLSN